MVNFPTIRNLRVLLIQSTIPLFFRLNTLTANYEYSRSNTYNLPLPVQMQLSEKLETFFIAFLESALNFEHFEKKMSLMAQVFPKLLTLKDVFT